MILIVAPWSGFWERNAFAQTEALAGLLASPMLRGAVSGIGFITALAGLAELAGAFVRRPPVEAEEPPAAEQQ